MIKESHILHCSVKNSVWFGFTILVWVIFQVAMKLTPERSKFYETLALGNSSADMERFVVEFSPILEENHNFLVSSTECPVLLLLFFAMLHHLS